MGTKALGNTGMKRMKALAEWASQRPEDTVVCVGHSLYFRSFFRVCFVTQREGGSNVDRSCMFTLRYSPCARTWQDVY